MCITNIDGLAWMDDAYSYDNAGNVETHTHSVVGETPESTLFSYSGDIMNSSTGADAFTLDWDENGRLLQTDNSVGDDVACQYNWDGRLRSAAKGSSSIDCIYDHTGATVAKASTADSVTSTERYILDVIGDYPMVLLVVNVEAGTFDKYYHAGGQTLMQSNGGNNYFYLHDRLGSTRQIINASGVVENYYTYDPWGNALSKAEGISNRYEFANYHWDENIGRYYLNARWYDPVIGRFTSRDPILGKFEEPLSLHKYLYCQNEPVNRIDPWGLWHWGVDETWNITQDAIEFVRERGPINGPLEAFGWRGGVFDIKQRYRGDTFEIAGNIKTSASEFGNYLTAYTCTYLYGSYGDYGVRRGGHMYSQWEYGEPDDIGSRYFISAGFLQAREDGGYHGGALEFINAKRTLNEYIIDILTTGQKYDQDSGYMTLSENQIIQELRNFTYFWNSGTY